MCFVTSFRGTQVGDDDVGDGDDDVGDSDVDVAVLVLCSKFFGKPSWVFDMLSVLLIILSLHLHPQPALEDASNIMRVISVKNYCESTRVVIQLLQYQNKVEMMVMMLSRF